MVAWAPIATYNPATGFGLGAAANVAFFRGDPKDTHISALVSSLTATTKHQVLFKAKFNASSSADRWHLEGDNRLYWTSQSTFGLGTSAPNDAGVNAKFDFFRVYDTAYRRVRRNLYVGTGFLFNNHSNVEPNQGYADAWSNSAYVAYSEQHGLDTTSQTSAGASLNVLYDSRDSQINPGRGCYGSLGYQMFFEGLLGGSSTWQQANFDARTYARLGRSGRHRLAFWVFGNLVTGGVAPYFDLPATGWDTYGRSGRGYVQGRFRGEQLLYGEAEYRWTIKRNGLFGFVAFVNTETLSDRQTGERLFDVMASGAGVGMRLLVNKRSKTNLALDAGFGRQGSHGVYFGIQEAF